MNWSRNKKINHRSLFTLLLKNFNNSQITVHLRLRFLNRINQNHATKSSLRNLLLLKVINLWLSKSKNLLNKDKVNNSQETMIAFCKPLETTTALATLQFNKITISRIIKSKAKPRRVFYRKFSNLKFPHVLQKMAPRL